MIPCFLWLTLSTYIITFDSLTGPTSHKSVCHDLQRWLWFEARDKGKVEPGTKLPKAQYMEAKVPNQPNSSDCGVYLIHYFDCILRDPKKTIGFLGVRVLESSLTCRKSVLPR